MRRFVGPALAATGVLHVAVGLMAYARPLRAIAENGFLNAVESAPRSFDRQAAFWFIGFGVMVIVLGGMVHWAQARTGTVPTFLGVAMMAVGLAGVILIPNSGFWLVLPQAALMLMVARRGSRPL